MSKPKEETWYFCVDCNKYIKDREEVMKEHVSFYHSVKRRTPLSQRMVHTSKGGNIHKFMVDGNNWFVSFRLLLFKGDEATAYSKAEKWRFFATVPLDGEILEVVKKLNHIHQTAEVPLTVKTFKDLVRDAIKKGKYSEHGTSGAKLLICLDSDAKLIPRSPSSQYTVITKSELKRLIKSEPESLAEAWQHAQQSEM